MHNRVKTIREIRNTDAFDAFTWKGGYLARYNLIYGWNGSGKTTISRLFNFLERRRIHLPELSTIDFNIQTDTGSLRKQDITSHDLDARVFNEDFVKDNLAFDESRANKIVIIGKDNIEIQEDISTLEAEKKKAEEDNKRLIERRAALPKIDSILTEAGREVTKQFGNTPLANHEYYGRSYNKTRVEAKIEDGTVNEANIDSLVISQTELDSHREVIKSELPTVSISLSELADFSVVFLAANDLLGVSVNVEGMEELRDDKELRDWTETGYHLHTTRNLTSCQFCKNTLDNEFLNRLGNFFSDELQKVKTDIDQKVSELEKLRKNLDGADLDSGRLLPSLVKEYLAVKSRIDGNSYTAGLAIETLTNSLKRKKDSLHDQMAKFTKIEYPTAAITSFNKGVNEAVSIVDRHNNLVDKDSDTIRKAALGIELHTIASILASKEYFTNKKETDELDATIGLFKRSILGLAGSINTKRAALQNTSIAVDKINGFLKEFFGESQIYLEVTDPGSDEVGYVLKSRGKDAKYLSQAEKSVLALVYFFIKLEEDGCDKKNCLIVIDDPVDSQDGVFLFRTFGLLKRQLKDSGQLIVLTHNFDFFNLIRDWLVSDGQKDKSKLYLISLDNSPTGRLVTVDDLPELLREYKSEYQYLFSRLYHYERGTKPLDEPLVANVGRKILEYFSGFKWSCRTTEQFTNIVLNRFVADQNHLKKGTGDFIVKFVNEYSHGQDFSRPVSASMLESKAIAQNILIFIRLADKEHYDDLKALCLCATGLQG